MKQKYRKIKNIWIRLKKKIITYTASLTKNDEKDYNVNK